MKFLSLEPETLHKYVCTLVLGPLSWDNMKDRAIHVFVHYAYIYQWDTRNVFERDFTSNGKQWTN